MTFAQFLVLIIFLIPIVLVIFGRLRMDLAALSIAALLGISQLLGLGVLGPANTPSEALTAFVGLNQPAVITLLGLFILTHSLDQTGVTYWVARRIIKIGKGSVSRLIVLFSGATALMSLFMNNVAAGALLLPGALETSRRTGIKPSKLLIPIAFGSLLGGMATYFTTANIIISDLLHTAVPPQSPLNMLHFLPTGGLIAILGILYLGVFGQRLLPEREPGSLKLINEVTDRQVEDYYQLGERLWELKVHSGSPLAGKTLGEASLGKQFGLTVSVIWRGEHAIFAPSANEYLRFGDILLVVGREERIRAALNIGLELGNRDVSRPLTAQNVVSVELMVAPHSSAEGKTLKQLDFRLSTGFTILALRRGNRNYRTDVGDIPLTMGDALLVVGSSDRLKSLRSNPAFFLLEPAPAEQIIDRQRAGITITIIFLAIAASIAGIPTSLAMFVGALLVIFWGVISMEDAYRAIEWSVIFQIVGMVALSKAMVVTGLSNLVGDGILRLVSPFGPIGLAVGGFMLAALLTQLIGGQVTALVVGPVVISSAISLGINPQAVAVAAAIGCSASFLTPMAHPVNILIMTPGNYKFSDFFRVGWPLMVICLFAIWAGLKLFWGL